MRNEIEVLYEDNHLIAVNKQVSDLVQAAEAEPAMLTLSRKI